MSDARARGGAPEAGGAQRWHVYQSGLHQETIAGSGITAALGFATFVPVRLVLSRKHDKRYGAPVARPIFQQYGFVQFSRQLDAWQRINRVRGVQCILGGLSPVPVPSIEVEDLIAAQLAGAFNDSPAHFAPNDPVTITAGAWAKSDFVTRVLAVAPDQSAVQILLGQMRVWVDPLTLTPA